MNGLHVSVIRSFAQHSYPDVIKTIKNQLKNPLSEPHPVSLLGFNWLGRVGEDWVMEDAEGERIVLSHAPTWIKS